MSHKRLKKYSVVAGDKMSKIIEFSKGEAEIFVQNFIETHLSHGYIKAAGGLKNITAYFCDTKIIKNQLDTQINHLISGIDKMLIPIVNPSSNPESSSEDTTDPLTPEQRQALLDAKTLLEEAKQSVTSVEDGADFNKENINQAKNLVSDTIENLINHGISTLIDYNATGNDEETSSIHLPSANRQINNNLNKLRKWQFDMFAEEYSAEIYTESYHDYKYAKTIPELCEAINKVLKSISVSEELDPTLYKLAGNEVIRNDETGKNIEEDIKQILQKANIKFKRIDIDWHDKNYEPDDDTFGY